MENITKRGVASLRPNTPMGSGGALDDTFGRSQHVRFEFPFEKATAASAAAAAAAAATTGATTGGGTKGHRAFAGHFDAYCPWLMSDLDTNAFFPDVGYTRMRYILKETDEVGNRALLQGGLVVPSTQYQYPVPNARNPIPKTLLNS
jgi:hypothetical protein